MHKKKTAKLIGIFLILSMAVSVIQVNVLAYVSPLHDTSDVYIDKNGDKITSQIIEDNDKVTVKIFINGELDHVVITDKHTMLAEITTYSQDNLLNMRLNTSKTQVDLNSLVTDTADADIAPYGTLEPTYSFTISNRIRTDYSYNGSVLYADCSSKAYEQGESYRYNGKILQLSAGTAVGTVLSIIAAYFTGGAWTVATVASIGIPVVGGVIADYYTSEVCYTLYRVYTDAYINGIYMVYGYTVYNKVLVNVDASGIFYTDDYYGYNIIRSHAEQCAYYAGNHFYEKFISCSKPNLSLPVTYT